MANIPPGRFPPPPGTPYAFVGPNYQKHQEISGYLYNPYTDKYRVDPKAAQAQGLIPKDPKSPGLSDIIVPVAAVGAGGALATQFGKDVYSGIGDLIPSFGGGTEVAAPVVSGGGVGGSGIGSVSGVTPTFTGAAPALPNAGLLGIDAGVSASGAGSVASSLAPGGISGAQFANSLLPGVGLLAGTYAAAPAIVDLGKKLFGSSAKARPFDLNELVQNPGKVAPLANQIPGFYDLPDEIKREILTNAYNAGALVLPGEGITKDGVLQSQDRMAESLAFKDFWERAGMRPQNEGPKLLPSSFMDWRNRIPTKDEVYRYAKPEERDSLLALVDSIENSRIYEPVVSGEMPQVQPNGLLASSIQGAPATITPMPRPTPQSLGGMVTPSPSSKPLPLVGYTPEPGPQSLLNQISQLKKPQGLFLKYA